MNHYVVKMGKDGKYRFYMLDIEEKVKLTRQATKKDIKRCLVDIRNKRELYDKALLEYVK